MDDEAIGTAELTRALDQTREKLQVLDSEMNTLHKEYARLKMEAELLGKLLDLREGRLDTTNARAETRKGAAPSTRGKASGKATHHPSAVRAVELLEEAGHPMHVSELMSVLKSEGVPLPGAGTQANLIAHMTRHPRITRVSRGVYALTDWDYAPSEGATRQRSQIADDHEENIDGR